MNQQEVCKNNNTIVSLDLNVTIEYLARNATVLNSKSHFWDHFVDAVKRASDRDVALDSC